MEFPVFRMYLVGCLVWMVALAPALAPVLVVLWVAAVMVVNRPWVGHGQYGHT